MDPELREWLFFPDFVKPPESYKIVSECSECVCVCVCVCVCICVFVCVCVCNLFATWLMILITYLIRLLLSNFCILSSLNLYPSIALPSVLITYLALLTPQLTSAS